jgi:branched-chain amino acid transport system substrate-binding protein
MQAEGHGDANSLSEWALEGWAGGLWFADAAASCGADLTRSCVEKFMNNQKVGNYDGHGLLTPRDFHVDRSPPKTVHNCINVARWSDSRDAWITQVPDMDKNCFNAANLGYQAD